MQHPRKRAFGVGAAYEQRRCPDRFCIRLGEQRALVAHLADQRRGVVAEQLFRCRRQPPPGARPFERIQEDLQAAVDIASGDRLGRSRDHSGQPRGTGLIGRIEGGVEFTAGLGQDQLAQQIRPPLSDAKTDVAAAGVAHQVDRAGIQLLDEGDDVVDVLRDRIGVADAVPMVGEEMPQRRRDHAVPARQGTQHRGPDPKIAQRAVDADQRRAIAGALADIEIGHVTDQRKLFMPSSSLRFRVDSNNLQA